jgi:hypothetical protein
MGLATLLLMLFLGGGDTVKGKEQDEYVLVEVTVTAISGDGIYLDLGRDAGFEPGDRLRLFPTVGGPRPGKITAVSRTSSRAQVQGGVEGFDVGSRGEVRVPKLRLAERQQAAAEAQRKASETPSKEAPGPEAVPEPVPRVPDHPPWEAPPVEWDGENPLLAPMHGRPSEERPRRSFGEVYTSVDVTRDDGGGDSRQFTSLSTGVDWTIENPFGRGGRLDFDSEFLMRRSELATETTSDTRWRLDRFSYVEGGERERRDRIEVGRFLHHEFPELGLVDGVEYTHNLGKGKRLGASLGFLPRTDEFFTFADDLETSVFYQHATDESRTFQVGGGYQKTWHNGDADRDLFVGHLELHPSARTSLFSSVLVDWYKADDDPKPEGLQVTQLLVNASRRTEAGHGVGATISQFRIPILARDELDPVTAANLAEDETTRYGLDGWWVFSRRVRLNGHVDRWTDQDDSGGGLSTRLTLRDLLWPRGEVSLEAFTTDGKFSDGTGLRAQARKRFDATTLALYADATNYDQAAGESLSQLSLRFQLDRSIGRAWFFSLYAESRTGGDQDARSVGFLLQRSFD